MEKATPAHPPTHRRLTRMNREIPHFDAKQRNASDQVHLLPYLVPPIIQQMPERFR